MAETKIDEEISAEVEQAIKNLLNDSYTIMLYNDDKNTFSHVIECLVHYCKHSIQQAEQCATIVHFNGKCDIKHGTYENLEPICTALLDNGLRAKIK